MVMEINIKSYNGEHYVIDVQPNDDIYESILGEMKDTMMYQIVDNVFLGEEIIVPDSTFEEYDIGEGVTLYMNIGRKRASFTEIIDDLVALNPHLKDKKKELSLYEVWDENFDNVIGRDKVTVDSKEPWKVTGNLDWDNKQIKQLPESIGDLKLDGIFQLDENDFITLPNSFGGLEVSEDLFMGHGNLKKLPEKFGDLKVGKGLYLGYNKLESLPESFNNLTVGDDIWLSYNKLSELPDTPPNTGGVIKCAPGPYLGGWDRDGARIHRT